MVMQMRFRGIGMTILMMLATATACTTAETHPLATAKTAAATPTTTVASAAVEAPAPPLAPSDAVYPWGPSTTSERLDARFRAPPGGFTRVNVAAGSFGEFLRTLPLQPEGSPVVDYRGLKLYSEGRHPNIVAVADLDVGSRDLQHCADVIIRLHAEWRYGRGEHDLNYRSVSGQQLSYRGYVAGDRAIVEGKNIVIRRASSPRKDDHVLLRGWLDDVFNWAGTASLERDAKKVARSDLQPGDFFVMSGSPFGHAVLILDAAKDDKGRTALLLGQSYMPAQSFQVLRPSNDSAWFIVDVNDNYVSTPFWQPFPLTALRRL
jgi:hypothetical protein